MINIKAVQFLCSRLCHDLVGGSSAISAGLEFLESEGAQNKEAYSLIKDSAEQVARRLAFFRIAFGSIEGRPGKISSEEIKIVCEGFINKNKINLEWTEKFLNENWEDVPSSFAQIILNLILIAQSCLPRGGQVKIHSASMEGGKGIAIEIIGKDCLLMEDHALALDEDCILEDLNPKNIATYFAQGLAKSAGGKIVAETLEHKKGVTLAVLLPKI